MLDISNDSYKSTAIAHYDAHAPAMRNLEFFYDWVAEVVLEHVPHRASRFCDVGCGTGALLARLHHEGYSNLNGVDFSPGCLDLAQSTVPQANLAQHDIENCSLPSQYDAISMTTVLDFLASPQSALNHLHQSLNPNGTLLVHIRNRWAYWPWYHLRHIAPMVKKYPRLHHWLLWLTTPLGMRRSDQPFERVYSPPEVRRMIRAAGLYVVAETGMMSLPMFWLPGMSGLLNVCQAFDRIIRKMPGKSRYYQYMFVCKPNSGSL